MNEKLIILKPKERPIQIEPWFFRYLNEGQIKLVAAIILHADLRDRTNNSFPHNKTLAFYCGFGRIIKGTKAHEEYLNLNNDEEKKLYLKKKEKNSIQTVKNIKKSLEDIGLLTRDMSGAIGKQKTILTLDLNWKKEEFLKDFDNFFNKNKKTQEETEDVQTMLNNIIDMNKKGTSNESLLNMVKKLEKTLEPKDILCEHDISLLATFIMQSSKIQSKIRTKEINRPENYKKEIMSRIRKNSFEGIKKELNNLHQSEEKLLVETIFDSLKFDKSEITKNSNIYKLNKVKVNKDLIDVIYKFNQKELLYKLSADKFYQYTEQLLKSELSTKFQDFITSYEYKIEEYKKENNGK